MGDTGAGKTRFIDLAAKRTTSTANHNLEPGPRKTRKISCEHPDVKGRIVLVDTPGFDGSPGEPATSILIDVVNSLKSTHRNLKLVRIVYLHRISDNRHQDDSSLNNLSTFARLSKYRIGSVVFATTMWDMVKESNGKKREALLRDQYWEPALRRGSQLMRFQNSYESAWEILKSAISATSDTTHEWLNSSGGKDQGMKLAGKKGDREAGQKLGEVKGTIARMFGDRSEISCNIM
ncbi:hypothetical protein BDZ94DRAFT_1254585 [Collybia nuda]|uniref:G domain-containing protein n=1 Tax=Collybia nuda TaxID=64659 RepID=A0A9P6CLW9_9AGAR|nr:hypothetical protein BDZ94DRAFT_1254585 [Collybia nuda]